MAKKRFRDIEIWDKEWYMELSPRLKCLANYIFDNCDASGVLNPNWKLLNLRINDIEPITISDIKFLPKENFEILQNGKIFLPEFINFQYGSLSEKSPAHIPIFKAIKNNNLSDRVFNRVLNTLKEKEKEKEEEKEKEKEKEEEKESITKKEKKITPQNLLFKDSEYFDLENLRIALEKCKAPYCEANAGYYYEAMEIWSRENNKKKIDWLATCQNWILKDFKENKLVDKNYTPKNGTKQQNTSQYTNGRTPFDGISQQ